MKLKISKHDETICRIVREVIRVAVRNAKMPSAVAKRITTVAVRHRNQGRKAAINSHPFNGICEETGKKLNPIDKVLDELEPEKGYKGKVRWVCPKCNNSGKHSCG